MPHITLECTANVTIDFQDFFANLTQQLVATGHAPKLGIKCRVAAATDYYIIDGNAEYKMANLFIRLREGRNPEVLQNFSKIGMDLMETYFKEDIRAKKIILSTEIKELIKGLDLTKNSIR